MFGICGLLCTAVLVGRFVLAQGRRRSILRIVVQSTAVPYAVIAAGVMAASGSPRSASLTFFAVPALALAPLATVVAFARNDLWGSRALLSRVITRTVTGGLACAASACLGGAFAASLGVPFRAALAAAGAGAAASGPLLYLALRAVDRSFFPAVAHYKPTIEQLSEDLKSISAPQEIASAIERTVRRWLPCDRVEFVASDEVERVVPANDLAELSIAAMFGGRTLGVIRVGHKRGGALFTTEDIDLLQTIANQAALAVAYARSYAELEQRRRQQAAAWQVERLALVETLAAEVAHEVRYPINFFRSIFQRSPDDGTLASDEIEVGCEEVERLERLVSGLKRLVGYHVERRVVTLVELANHAEVLLRDALGNRMLRVAVPSDVSIRCDADQVRQVLVNLVSNALDASGPRGRGRASTGRRRRPAPSYRCGTTVRGSGVTRPRSSPLGSPPSLAAPASASPSRSESSAHTTGGSMHCASTGGPVSSSRSLRQDIVDASHGERPFAGDLRHEGARRRRSAERAPRHPKDARGGA